MWSQVLIPCLTTHTDTDIPANGLYFMSYEIMTNEYMRRFDRPNVDLLAAIIAGGMAGIFYWIGGMPADVLKSRLQSGKSGKYVHFHYGFMLHPLYFCSSWREI